MLENMISKEEYYNQKNTMISHCLREYNREKIYDPSARVFRSVEKMTEQEGEPNP